jgi:hypothetical protein
MSFNVLDDFMLVQLAAAPVSCRCPLPLESECDVNRCAECWACLEQLVVYANSHLYGRQGFAISKKALRQDLRWSPAVWSALRRALMQPQQTAPAPAPAAAAPAAPSVAVVVHFCIICMDQFAAGPALTCGHRFHQACVRQWLRRSRTCPICRAPQP